MKVKKVISLVVITLLYLSVLSIMAAKAIEVEPYDFFDATYMAGDIIDGDFSTWYNNTFNYIDLYHFDGYIVGSIYYSFTYNETHLMGAFEISLPSDYVLNGFDINFIGKEGQYDGIHIDLLNNYIDDLVFPEDFGPPEPDVVQGGTNDVTAAFIIGENSTTIEIAKPLDSGDVAGEDIALVIGSSIGVEFFAWVNTDPSAEGPNAGISVPNGEFRYIRLNIEYDGGDILDFPFKEIFGPPTWVQSYDFYAKGSSPMITFDGNISEDAWYNIGWNYIEMQYFEWETGYWDENLTIYADLAFYFDDYYLYGAIDVYVNEYSPDNLFFAIAIGPYMDFYFDMNGFDLLLFDYYEGAVDCWMPDNHSMAIPDIELGGIDDIVNYGMNFDGYTFTIEFQKVLAPYDYVANDPNFYPGDTIFLAFAAGVSAEGGPNYVDISPIYEEGYYVPALSIHPMGLYYEEGPPITEGQGVKAPYIESPNIVIDGIDNETEWQNADVLDITFEFADFDSSYASIAAVQEIHAKFKIFNDGENIYIFAKFDHVLDSDSDFVALGFSENADIFGDDNRGLDVFILNLYHTEDLWLDFRNNDVPVPDTELGGHYDGNGILIVQSSETTIEFTRPLNTGDSYDAVMEPGKVIYFFPFVALNSTDGPNFFEFYHGTEYDSFVTHPIEIVEAGASTNTETSGGEGEGTNTLTIGFSATEVIVISITFVGVVAAVSRRKRK